MAGEGVGGAGVEAEEGVCGDAGGPAFRVGDEEFHLEVGGRGGRGEV